MGYSNDVMQRARARLAAAKADRESENRQHLDEAYAKVPRLREIDRQLRLMDHLDFLRDVKDNAVWLDMSEVEPMIHTVVREVERIVPVERVVVKPIVRRKVRIQYRNHPGHMLLLGVICFLVGLILGCLM